MGPKLCQKQKQASRAPNHATLVRATSTFLHARDAFRLPDELDRALLVLERAPNHGVVVRQDGEVAYADRDVELNRTASLLQRLRRRVQDHNGVRHSLAGLGQRQDDAALASKRAQPSDRFAHELALRDAIVSVSVV